MCFRLLLWSTNKLPISLLKFAFPKETKRKEKKRNVLGSSFRVLFLQTPPQSHFAKQIPPEMAGVRLFVFFFFCFFLAFHFCCSLTRLSQQCQKGPDLPQTAAVNEIQPLIPVFLPRLGWVYFAILERWLLFQSALPLISQLSKAAKFVLAVFSFWTSVSTLPFLSCLISRDKHTQAHTHTHTHMLVYPECCFHVIRVLKYFFHSSLKEYLTFLMPSP